MAVDRDGCLIEPEGGFAKASKRETDQFFQRMLVLADDATLPADYRACVTKAMADVHKRIQAIPATMSAANRWAEAGAILALAAYWLPDVKPVVAATKPVSPEPVQPTPPQIDPEQPVDGCEFF
jgi:hypothetical protein